MAEKEAISVVQAVRNLVSEMLELEPEEVKEMAELDDKDVIAIVSNYMVTKFQRRFLKERY